MVVVVVVVLGVVDVALLLLLLLLLLLKVIMLLSSWIETGRRVGLGLFQRFEDGLGRVTNSGSVEDCHDGRFGFPEMKDMIDYKEMDAMSAKS